MIKVSDIESWKKRTIEFNDLRMLSSSSDYDALYRDVCVLVDENILLPVKASGTNGRVPPLSKKYRIALSREAADYTDEIRALYPTFRILHYSKHPEQYARDRDVIKPLSDFMHCRYNELKEPLHINERSLQIWGNEKFIRGDKDNRTRIQRILESNGMGMDILNCYDPAYPFEYYVVPFHCSNGPILIVENYATYCSLKIISETVQLPYDVVVFGEGRKITSPHCIDDLRERLREEAGIDIKSAFYFGDLDPAGIRIMTDAADANDVTVEPDNGLYRLLLEKGAAFKIPMHRSQVVNYDLKAITFSKESDYEILRKLFERNLFLPQEITNRVVLKEFFEEKGDLNGGI